jgi:hypothetical protein
MVKKAESVTPEKSLFRVNTEEEVLMSPIKLTSPRKAGGKLESKESSKGLLSFNDTPEDLMLMIRMRGLRLLEKSCTCLIVLMIVVTTYSCFFDQFAEHSMHVRVTIPVIVIFLA